MKTFEKIGFAIIIILICVTSYFLLITFKTLDELEKDTERFNYSRKYKGKIGPQEVKTYDYGDDYSTYMD